MALNQLMDVQDEHRLNEERLWQYLRDHLVDFSGTPEIRQFRGAESNPTYLITAPDRQYVLRKQPDGERFAGAHAVHREYRVQAALKGTPVPVPQMELFCDDPEIIGTPFYVMDLVPGRVFSDPIPVEARAEERGEIFHAFIDALATLHEVDYRAVGLEDFGRPEAYAARQVERWSKQYVESAAEPVEAMGRLAEWLRANLPPDEAAIVHGDYRLSNLMFEVDSPDVIAVLDWELSTIGHPLEDLGYVCMVYRAPASVSIFGGLGGLDLGELGIPPEDEIVSAYLHRSGRERLDDLGFFVAFAFFRLAAIAQTMAKRAQAGGTDRAHLAQEAAIALAEHGWRIAQSEADALRR